MILNRHNMNTLEPHFHFFFQVRRAIRSATRALKAKFVPDYLGFPHISRDEVIEHHTRPLARELFAKTMTENPAILVLDGTYIYAQKARTFHFQGDHTVFINTDLW